MTDLPEIWQDGWNLMGETMRHPLEGARDLVPRIILLARLGMSVWKGIASSEGERSEGSREIATDASVMIGAIFLNRMFSDGIR